MFRRRQPERQYGAVVSDLFATVLQSNVSGLYFNAEVNLSWAAPTLASGQRNPRDAARALILEVAEQKSGRLPVTRVAIAQHRINAELGRLGQIQDSEVHIDHCYVLLSTDPETAARGAEWERQQHVAQLANIRQEQELARLQRFRDAVLNDPGSAMTFWFMNHPDQLDEGLYGKLEALALKVAPYSPASTWVQVAKILHEFVQGLSSEEKQHLIRGLQQTFRSYGHEDGTQQLDELFHLESDTHAEQP